MGVYNMVKLDYSRLFIREKTVDSIIGDEFMEKSEPSTCYCERYGIFEYKSTKYTLAYYKGDFIYKGYYFNKKHEKVVKLYVEGVYKHTINFKKGTYTVEYLKRIPHCAYGTIFDN